MNQIPKTNEETLIAIFKNVSSQSGMTIKFAIKYIHEKASWELIIKRGFNQLDSELTHFNKWVSREMFCYHLITKFAEERILDLLK